MYSCIYTLQTTSNEEEYNMILPGETEHPFFLSVLTEAFGLLLLNGWRSTQETRRAAELFYLSRHLHQP